MLPSYCPLLKFFWSNIFLVKWFFAMICSPFFFLHHNWRKARTRIPAETTSTTHKSFITMYQVYIISFCYFFISHFFKWWRIQGSNLPPQRCKRCALPDELIPRYWSKRQESNLRPLAPKASVLPG